MKTTFKVLKMDCASCALTMEGVCEDTPGVSRAEVRVRDRMLEVEHDNTVQPATLAAALAAEGYPVEQRSE